MYICKIQKFGNGTFILKVPVAETRLLCSGQRNEAGAAVLKV